jgi:hypothetical protein
VEETKAEGHALLSFRPKPRNPGMERAGNSTGSLVCARDDRELKPSYYGVLEVRSLIAIVLVFSEGRDGIT